MSGSRVLIFTGDGKGKTTAALGMALRAIGHGMKVKIIQFVKADPCIGEIAALNMLPGVEIVQTGLGFVPADSSPKIEDHRQAGQAGLKIAQETISSGAYSLVVLDEVCFAVARHLVAEEDVVELVGKASVETTLVLTGRGATPALIELADTVTEMTPIKHGMQSGWPAQEGVEF